MVATPYKSGRSNIMAVASGTRLGVYDISAPIGEGGPPALAQKFAASFGEIHR
jgi:hypothetical protein